MIFEKQFLSKFEKRAYARADDTGAVFYFSAADFPGLSATPFSFPAREGHTLSGYFYESEGTPRRRTVIFDHGMGGGHRAYLREIAGLAGAGFRVFAYDHTGCWESEGDTTGGFCQSLSDLATLLEIKPNSLIFGRNQ